MSINGPIAHLESLAALTELRELELRQVWDLAQLPTLHSWPQLERLFAADMLRTDGTRLRQQAKEVAGLDAQVLKLRTPEWVKTYGHSPFRHWSGVKQKTAQKAFEAARSALDAATRDSDRLAALDVFVDVLNTLDAKPRTALDTVHREDAGTAVEELFAGSPLLDEANAQFDRRRTF